MKIVFICGSLQPGCDGVGDYTRRLAVELIRQGHQVTAIALHDHHISEVISDTQSQDSTQILVLRLPASLKEKMRFDYANNWVTDSDPDLLSLQFVPFSFHPKGISLGLGRELKNLGKGRKWHIMFHELWVGMEQDSAFSHIWWGKLQKKLIQNLLSSLQPVSICTHSHVYEYQFKKLNYQATILPLFSNIEMTSKPVKFKTPIYSLPNFSELQFIFFGGIHPHAPIEAFAKETALLREKIQKPVSFLFVGRNGSEYERWKTGLAAEGLPVECKGEQPADRISAFLWEATIGLTTTPAALADKSGSVAAMHAHSLPVLCVSELWSIKGNTEIDFIPGVAQYTKGNLESCLSEGIAAPVSYSVADIAKQFMTIFVKKNFGNFSI